MFPHMEINAAYQPRVSEQQRAQAFAEAAMLLQEVAALVVAKKMGNSVATDLNFRLESHNTFRFRY